MKRESLKILYASYEAFPFAASGDAGEIAGSLPQQIKLLGADIRVVLPFYATIPRRYRQEAKKISEFTVSLCWRNQYCGVFQLTRCGVTYYFIDNEYYFGRQSLYGFYDDGERFAFYSKAVIEMLPRIGFIPDVIHTNDWFTAASSIYLCGHFRLRDGIYSNIKCLHTICDFEKLGIFGMECLEDVFEMEDIRNFVVCDGAVNLTAGACHFADEITVYCDQPDVNSSLANSPVLSKLPRGCCEKLQRITIGIDTDDYCPSVDAELPCRYDVSDFGGKYCCKAELQRRLGLPDRCDVLMVAVVSRLTDSAGMELLTDALPELLHEDIQLIILGIGDSENEMKVRELSRTMHDKVASVIRYDRTLSRLVYAGADILLAPQRDGASNLNRMAAARYGTVSLSYSGGVLGGNSYSTETGEGTAFLFDSYTVSSMLCEFDRARRLFMCEKDRWNELVGRVVRLDNSIKYTAQEYFELYKSICNS